MYSSTDHNGSGYDAFLYSASRRLNIYAFFSHIIASLEAERERWFLWVPVSFGAGLGCYFSVLQEPSWFFVIGLLLAGIACILVTYRYVSIFFVIGFALSSIVLWMTLGFAAGKLRSAIVDTQTLQKKTGVVELLGWVEGIEKHKRNKFRVTIMLHRIENKPNTGIPSRARIRVSASQLKTSKDKLTLGSYMKFKAVLYPPPHPIIPGGFDYGRKLWFENIGAVGFAIAAPEHVKTKPKTPLWISLKAQVAAVRVDIAERIRTVLPGEIGNLAVALITGERSALADDTLQALRHSGLAHILAISGLHMAMIAGALYWWARALLAMSPTLALTLPIKKIAAIIALFGACYYLILSGAAIATQRAFIMIAIMFLAILLDRQALTLRNVAMAAMVILIIRPESLIDVGFQMSFAAVVVLIALYERTAQSRNNKRLNRHRVERSYISHIWTYFLGIAVTTMAASLAVAPFSIFHFHHLSQFGLLGNLLAIPIFGIVVMPMVLVALLLIPFGLETIPLTIMGWGIESVVSIAQTVSNLPGAVVHISQIPLAALIAMILGGLWLAIWQNRWRFWGIFGLALGVALCPTYNFPDIVVEREGKIIAVRQEDGRLIAPSQRGGVFSLTEWLRIYGDGRSIKNVRDKTLFRCDQLACITRVKSFLVSYIKHPAAWNEDCGKADIIIATIPHHGQCTQSKVVIDLTQLRRNGAHSLYLDQDPSAKNIVVQTVRQQRGDRPWVKY